MSTYPYASQVELEEQGDTLVIRLMGVWVLDREAPSFNEFLKNDAIKADIQSLMLETKDLKDWDSSLLVFLNQAK